MGDVVAIADKNGDFVAVYRYNAWGNVEAIETVDENNEYSLEVANANPLRYRGYYYDNETGYYYLQSRYYDPSICRFINADNVNYASKDISNGMNIFAYCNNNPINNEDSTGYWAEKIAYKYTKTSYNLRVSRAYLSKVYCLIFAKNLIKNAYKVTKYGKAKKGECFGMTAHRMAVEIWFHAMVYYGGSPLAKVCTQFKEKIWDHADPITVNKGDKRVAYFYIAWYAATAIKIKLLRSKVPNLVKIGAAIVL